MKSANPVNKIFEPTAVVQQSAPHLFSFCSWLVCVDRNHFNARLNV